MRMYQPRQESCVYIGSDAGAVSSIDECPTPERFFADADATSAVEAGRMLRGHRSAALDRKIHAACHSSEMDSAGTDFFFDFADVLPFRRFDKVALNSALSNFCRLMGVHNLKS